MSPCYSLLRLTVGHHKRLPLNGLGNLLWALGSLLGSRKIRKPCRDPEAKFLEKLHVFYDVYHALQKEILRRTSASSESDSASIFLQVLWASAFSQQLPTSILLDIKSSVLRFADSLDLDQNPTHELVSQVSIQNANMPTTQPLESPRIVKTVSHALVVLKPAGWEARLQNVFRCFQYFLQFSDFEMFQTVLKPCHRWMIQHLRSICLVIDHCNISCSRSSCDPF